MDYAKKILKVLVDKYEKSVSFTGKNKVAQSFSIEPGKLFKKYNDHSEYILFEEVNDGIGELEALDYVMVTREVKSVKKVQLKKERLEEIYDYLGLVPKKLINEKLLALYEIYSKKNELLDHYIEVQKVNISKNQKVYGFKGELKDYEELLSVLVALFNLNKETYERDFSVRMFGDSKRFKELESRVLTVINEYGDYPNRDSILGELNLLKNPSYVYVKGQGSIRFGEQTLDLSKLSSDIAISSESLADVTSIKVLSKSVITVENLTSFYTFPSDQMLVVYLGGFHNRVRRDFLKQIQKMNEGAKFYHFGDIDIGGILIYEHLKRKTGIDFEPYEMSVSNLIKYKKMTKALTENDRKRGKSLVDGPWRELVVYMLEHDCKLEQEAIDIRK